MCNDDELLLIAGYKICPTMGFKNYLSVKVLNQKWGLGEIIYVLSHLVTFSGLS